MRRDGVCSKRESTQRTRGANQKERALKEQEEQISCGRNAEQSPCEDMVCAQIEKDREREHTQRTRGANQKERELKEQ
jgi:hypothetical protein